MDNYTVYGKEGCPYCVKAVALLERESLAHNYIDIVESEIDKSSLAERLGVVEEKIRTVPQIVYIPDVFEPTQKEYVGGFDDLKERLSA